MHTISLFIFLSVAVCFLWQATTAFGPLPIPRQQTTTTSTLLTMSASEQQSSSLPALNPKETALVMIEYQNEFAAPGGKLHEAVKPCMDKTNMLANSIQLVNDARKLGCKIIHCPISFAPGHPELSKTFPYGILAGVQEGGAFEANTWNAAQVAGMEVFEKDLVVHGKSGLCGFASTNLDFLLRQHLIRNVVLGGFLTNCCVESTMRSAYELGYQVYTLTDCVAATSIEAQEATLEYNFGMFSIPTTSMAIRSALQQQQAVPQPAV